MPKPTMLNVRFTIEAMVKVEPNQSEEQVVKETQERLGYVLNREQWVSIEAPEIVYRRDCD